jgi:hypothetical protein
MKITVHIERLMLEACPVTTRTAGHVKSGFERELARLLSRSGLSPELHAGGAISVLKSQNMTLKSTVSPCNVGLGVARAVFRSLAKHDARPDGRGHLARPVSRGRIR